MNGDWPESPYQQERCPNCHSNDTVCQNGGNDLSCITCGHISSITPEDIPRKINGQWQFERSSGFAGFRCQVCAEWVYMGLPLMCDCDKLTVIDKQFDFAN